MKPNMKSEMKLTMKSNIQKKLNVLSLFLILLFTGFVAPAAPAGQSLTVQINAVVSGTHCRGPLQGFVEGDQITLHARVPNASGGVRYRFWHTNEGFKVSTPQSAHGQTDVSGEKWGSRSKTFRLRSLQDDLSRIHMTLGVTVQDSAGRTGSASLRMRVTRSIIIERNQENPNPVCFQTYAPECVSAEYFNQNDTDLKVTVSQVEQKLSEQRFQKGSSWAISPSVFFSGVAVSFFSYQWGHFNSLAHQSSDSVYLTVENMMSPGDVGSIYRQRTRLMIPYRVSVLDSCRRELDAGQAFLDTWQRSYNLIKKDPLSPRVCDLKNVGSPVVNTCADIDRSMVKHEFYGAQP